MALDKRYAGLKLAAPDEEAAAPPPEPDGDGLDPRVLDYAREHRSELFTSEAEVPTHFRDLLPLSGPITPHVYYVPSLLSGSEFTPESVQGENYRRFMIWYEDAPGIYPVAGPHNSFAVAIRLNVITEDMLIEFDEFQGYPEPEEKQPGGVEEDDITTAWDSWAKEAFFSALVNKFPDFEPSIKGMGSESLKTLFDSMRTRAKIDWTEDKDGHAFIDVDAVANLAVPEDFSGPIETGPESEPEPEPEKKEASVAESATPIEQVMRNTFRRAYFEAALFSSTDDEGRPLDKDYSIRDFDAETMRRMIEDCERFESQVGDLLVAENLTYQGYDPEQAGGHDFWLTRNRHGAGFKDGHWVRDVAEKLTAAAHAFGEFDLFVGDDGKISGQ